MASVRIRAELGPSLPHVLLVLHLGGPGGAPWGHLRGPSLSTPKAKKPRFAGSLLLVSPSSGDAAHRSSRCREHLGSCWKRAVSFNYAPADWKGLELGALTWLPYRSRRLIIEESAASKLIRPKSRLWLSCTCPSNCPPPLGIWGKSTRTIPLLPPGWAAGALPSLPSLSPASLPVGCPANAQAAVGKFAQRSDLSPTGWA